MWKIFILDLKIFPTFPLAILKCNNNYKHTILITGELKGLDPQVKLGYQKGGYPPLILQFEDDHLYVIARSDPSYFVRKKGCSPDRSTLTTKHCPETEDGFGKQVE